ncbi:MAG: hypothetical protein LBN00_12470 [Oscillospiraceae bacterium]|jgi:hypothetical protein|nr:hypothetical protein [Oscillospiraceae bacterium]
MKAMKNTSLFVILSLFLAAVVLGSILVMRGIGDNSRVFTQDGFVLSDDVYATDEGTFPFEYRFVGGTEYRPQYPEKVTFLDEAAQKISVEAGGFVHYSDGSFGTLSDAVLMNLAELGASFVNYYNVTPATSIERVGNSYQLQQTSGQISIDGFILKLKSGKMLITGPSLELYMTNTEPTTYDGYLEVSYIDENVIKITHENGVLFTVAPECYVMVEDVRVDLANRKIVREGAGGITGDVMYLDQMIIGADDNINLLGDPQTGGFDFSKFKLPEIKLPTFLALDGEEGAAGSGGRAGIDGIVGKMGDGGDDGDIGQEGRMGTEGLPGDLGEDGVDGANGVNGAAGTTGSQGKTQGSAGGAGDDTLDDSNMNSIKLPSMKLNPDPSKFTTLGGGVKGSVTLKNGELLGVTQSGRDTDVPPREDGKAMLKITESATGRVIYRGTGSGSEGYIDLGQADGVDELFEITADTIAAYDANSDGTADGYRLIEGAEYILTVDAYYEYLSVVYNKIFISKVFRVSSAGIDAYLTGATPESLTYTVVRSIGADGDPLFRGANATAKLVLYDAETGMEVPGTTTLPVGSNAAISDAAFGNNNETTLTFTSATPGALLPNHHYKAKIVQINIASNSYPDGVFVDGWTLKRTPTIGGVNVIAGQGYTLQVNLVNDPDNGIKKYRYEFYNVSTNPTGDAAMQNIPVVYSVESTNREPIAGAFKTPLQANTDYRVRVVGIFEDNEKTVEVFMDYDIGTGTDWSASTPVPPTPDPLKRPTGAFQHYSPTFRFTMLNMPRMNFTRELYYTNPPTNTILDDASNATRIKGSIVITDIYRSITNNSFNIVIKNASGAVVAGGRYDGRVAVTGGSVDAPTYTLPYESPVGLQVSSEYIISVEGYVNPTGGAGSNAELMTIGNAFVSTGTYSVMAAHMMSVAGTGVMNVGVSIRPLAAANLPDTGGPGGYPAYLTTPEGQADIAALKAELGAIERIEFVLYSGDVQATLRAAQKFPSGDPGTVFANEEARNTYYDQSRTGIDPNDSTPLPHAYPANGTVVSCGSRIYIWNLPNLGWDSFDPESIYDNPALAKFGESLVLVDGKRYNANNIILENGKDYRFVSDFQALVDNWQTPLVVTESTFGLTGSYFTGSDNDYTLVMKVGYDYTWLDSNKASFVTNYSHFTKQSPNPTIPTKTMEYNFFNVTPITKANLSKYANSTDVYKKIIKEAPTSVDQQKINDYVATLEPDTILGYHITVPAANYSADAVLKTESMTFGMYEYTGYDSSGPIAFPFSVSPMPPAAKYVYKPLGDAELDATNINTHPKLEHIADFNFKNTNYFLSNSGKMQELNVFFTPDPDAYYATGADAIGADTDGISYYDTASATGTSGPAKIVPSTEAGNFNVYIRHSRGEQYFFTMNSEVTQAGGGLYHFPSSDPEPTHANQLARSLRLDTPKQSPKFRFYQSRTENDAGANKGYTPYIRYNLLDIDKTMVLVGGGDDLQLYNVDIPIPGATLERSDRANDFTKELAIATNPTTAGNEFMINNGFDLEAGIKYSVYNKLNPPETTEPSIPLFHKGFEAYQSWGSGNTGSPVAPAFTRTKLLALPVGDPTSNPGVRYTFTDEFSANRFKVALSGFDATYGEIGARAQMARVAAIVLHVTKVGGTFTDANWTDTNPIYEGASTAKYILAVPMPSAGTIIPYYLPYAQLPGGKAEDSTNYSVTVEIIYDEGDVGIENAVGAPSGYFAIRTANVTAPNYDDLISHNGTDVNNFYRTPTVIQNASQLGTLNRTNWLAGGVFKISGLEQDNSLKTLSATNSEITFENMLTTYQQITVENQRTTTLKIEGIDQHGLKLQGTNDYVAFKKLSVIPLTYDTTNQVTHSGSAPEITITGITPGYTDVTINFDLKNWQQLDTESAPGSGTGSTTPSSDSKRYLYLKLWGGNSGGSSNTQVGGPIAGAGWVYHNGYKAYGNALNEWYTIAIDLDSYVLPDGNNTDTKTRSYQIVLDSTGANGAYNLELNGGTGLQSGGKQYWVSFWGGYATASPVMQYRPLSLYNPSIDKVPSTNPEGGQNENKYLFTTLKELTIGPVGNNDPVLNKVTYIPTNYRDRVIQMEIELSSIMNYYLFYEITVVGPGANGTSIPGGPSVGTVIPNQALEDANLFVGDHKTPAGTKFTYFDFKPGNNFMNDSKDFWKSGTQYKITVTGYANAAGTGTPLGTRDFMFTMPALIGPNYTTTYVPSVTRTGAGTGGDPYVFNYHLDFKVSTVDRDRTVVDVESNPNTGNIGAYKIRVFKKDSIGNISDVTNDPNLTMSLSGVNYTGSGGGIADHVFTELYGNFIEPKFSGLEKSTEYTIRFYAITNTANIDPTSPADVTELPPTAFEYSNNTYVVHEQRATTTNESGISVGTVTASQSNISGNVLLTFTDSANITGVTEIQYDVQSQASLGSVGSGTMPLTTANLIPGAGDSYSLQVPASISNPGVYIISARFYTGGVLVGSVSTNFVVT